MQEVNEKMTKEKLRKMMLSALFAALTCAATIVIQIPMPATNGYVNIGDCFVLLGAWVLEPLYGAFAGGVGAALADLLTGYTHYVPGTLVIKALMSLLAVGLFRALRRRPYLGYLASGLAAEVWMVLGYFGYASLLLGKGLAAAGSIPGNLIQGGVGIVAAIALVAALRETKILEKVSQHG